MKHTRTEESEFGQTIKSGNLGLAVSKAQESMIRNAEAEGFAHMVVPTFKVVTTLEKGELGETYTATASATFARIVPTSPFVDEPNEGDMDGEREARGPEEKDYSDLEPF